MNPLVAICLTFFSIWIFLTCLWQFEGIRKKYAWLRKINFLNLLPIWTFFAPSPGMYDTHLLFRDKKGGGEVTDWVEVVVTIPREQYHFVWNPLKRRNKLVVDAISEVKSIKNDAEKQGTDPEIVQNQIKFSKGYLILLNIISKEPKVDDTSRARQFIVCDATHISGERNLIPLFVSPFHLF